MRHSTPALVPCDSTKFALAIHSLLTSTLAMASLLASLTLRSRSLVVSKSNPGLHKGVGSKRPYSDIREMRAYLRQQRANKNTPDAASQPEPLKPVSKAPINTSASPIVITVAVTGDVAQKSRVNVPITPKEQVEQIVSSYEAGARMVHVHVRDDNGKPTWDPKRYAEVLEGTRKYCPDMILQFSTGNYAPTLEERMQCLYLKPEMASLTPGSVNFKNTRPGKDTAKHYFNTHEEIDVLAKKMLDLQIKPDVALFDVSMIYATADLIRRGLITLPVRLMFVVGGHMALEARRPLIEFMLSESRHAIGEGNFTWTAVGVGWNNASVMKWTVELGGHLRTGLEDTMMLKRGVFAKDNAELVRSVADLCHERGRRLATPEEARVILGIPPRGPALVDGVNRTFENVRQSVY